jgi:hypothetical protein
VGDKHVAMYVRTLVMPSCDKTTILPQARILYYMIPLLF